MKKEYKIIILCGLPGSGKTWWTINTKFDSLIDIIHFDDYQGQTLKSIFGKLCIFGRSLGKHTIIFDGLFLTNQDVIQIIQEVYDILGKSDLLEFEIHQWEGNREDCLFNDSYRGRESLSKATILGRPIEDISLDLIQETYKEYKNIKILEPKIIHQVHRCTTHERDFGGKDLLVSKKWCFGGTWYDEKGNNGIIEREETPEFIELYDYIQEVFPEANYNEIKKKFVNLQTKIEYDYYGGSWEDGWWECDLVKLFKYLENV